MGMPHARSAIFCTNGRRTGSEKLADTAKTALLITIIFVDNSQRSVDNTYKSVDNFIAMREEPVVWPAKTIGSFLYAGKEPLLSIYKTVALFWLLPLQTVGSICFFSAKTVGYFSENQWFRRGKPKVNVKVNVNVNVKDK